MFLHSHSDDDGFDSGVNVDIRFFLNICACINGIIGLAAHFVFCHMEPGNQRI